MTEDLTVTLGDYAFLAWNLTGLVRPDLFLVIWAGSAYGRRVGLLAAGAGTAGIAVLTGLALAGFSQMVVFPVMSRKILTVVFATYLAWLAVRLIREKSPRWRSIVPLAPAFVCLNVFVAAVFNPWQMLIHIHVFDNLVKDMALRASTMAVTVIAVQGALMAVLAVAMDYIMRIHRRRGGKEGSHMGIGGGLLLVAGAIVYRYIF